MQSFLPRGGRHVGVSETVNTRIGKLDFELRVPTQATVNKLYDDMDYQRACQLYLWAFPNLEVNLEGTTGALPGDLTIYLGTEQSIFFTPNATTPYIVGYLDMAKTGPVVMDIPPGPLPGQPRITGRGRFAISASPARTRARVANMFLSGGGRKHRWWREPSSFGRRRLASSCFTGRSTPTRRKARRWRSAYAPIPGPSATIRLPHAF